MKLRVMTFNIQHCASYRTGRIQPEVMTDAIREIGADLCGLNEVRGLGKSPEYTPQAETMAALLGWHGVFGRSVYIRETEPYGNGLVSRFPIRKMEIIPIPDPIFTENPHKVESRSILRCELDVEDGFVVYQTHFGLYKEDQEHGASLAHCILKAESLPAVLMGDFNMAPDHPLLAPFYRDFVSTEEMLQGKLSFPSDEPTIKIDYIFANKKVNVLACDIPPIVASDHRPVWADISF